MLRIIAARQTAVLFVYSTVHATSPDVREIERSLVSAEVHPAQIPFSPFHTMVSVGYTIVRSVSYLAAVAAQFF